jgi:hypothetical protein
MILTFMMAIFVSAYAIHKFIAMVTFTNPLVNHLTEFNQHESEEGAIDLDKLENSGDYTFQVGFQVMNGLNLEILDDHSHVEWYAGIFENKGD